MAQHIPAVADAGFDVLAHINPRSPTFYQECAAVAAYLIHGEGQAFGRCVLTAAIMHHPCRLRASTARVLWPRCTAPYRKRAAKSAAALAIVPHRETKI